MSDHSYRIQILRKNVVRFESCPNGNFSNQPSLFAANKRKSNETITLKNENGQMSFGYDGFLFSFEENQPLETLKVYENGQEVYHYHEIKNSGELPLPNKTPAIFPLMDAPRILIPEMGYQAGNEGYIIQNDVRDLYLFLCHKDSKKLREQYLSVTGKNELARLKNFGLFSSRYFEYSQKSAMEMIKQYEKYHLPLDTFVLDTDWRISLAHYGCGYQVNEALFPNIEKFYQFAHQRNVQVMMNDHPLRLNKSSTVFDEEEIRYRNENLTSFYNKGLDGWWYDRNWPCDELKSPDRAIQAETLGNYLFNDIAKQYYSGFSLDSEVYLRPLVMNNITDIHNGVYQGLTDSSSHRYSLQWSGDTYADEYSLRNEIINMNRCANNALGYYSSDIGGHMGNPNKSQYIRWFEYGAFSPVLRPHCTKDEKRYREPWNYDKATLTICRNYVNMRYRLLNVFYTAAYKNVESGLGICSPLSLYYPEDKKVYKEETSYLINNQLFVSPVTNASKEKHLDQKCFTDSLKVYIYPNDSFSGRAYIKVIKSFKDTDKFFAKVKLDHPEAKKFSIRYKGTLSPRHDVTLRIHNEVEARVIMNKEIVFDDFAHHWSEEKNIGSIKKNKKYDFVLETLQSRRLKPVDVIYYRTLNNHISKIYLPEGEWYNMYHKNVYQGKRYIKEKYKLDETPIFVRAGSLLCLYKTVDNISNMSLRNVVYDYYPSKKETTMDYFYEDDGVTTSYLTGVYRKNEYKTYYEDNKYIVELKGNDMVFDDNVRQRNVFFKMHVRDNEQIEQVLVNGEAVKFKRHDHAKNIIPFLDDEFSKESKTLSFRFKQNIKDDYRIELIIKK